MPRQPTPLPSTIRRQRGFEAAASLVKAPIRAAGEKRGFALARLLTHWPDVAGTDVAAVTRPVKMSYGREGMGATLVLLVTSAHAPMVQMQLPRIRERVNAAYGYAAVSRITLTQTAADGFAEGQTPFSGPPPPPPPDPAIEAAAAATAADVGDGALRSALEAMAKNILARRPSHAGKKIP
ncbi:MAG: DUF721 domain-containing protein [Pseudomonadota bacterium]